jgi:hypothetical protein
MRKCKRHNLAERQLRLAVIARKLSCGNKTAAGAHTWEVLSSLAATCAQRAQSFVELVAGCPTSLRAAADDPVKDSKVFWHTL